jgi:hypothetical protein
MGLVKIDMNDPAYYLSPMAMGKRPRRATQTSMWVAVNDLPRAVRRICSTHD